MKEIKNPETVVALPPIRRTADGLRDALFDEIDLLRAGKVTTAHARSLANLVRQAIDFARLELQHRKLLGSDQTKRLGRKNGASSKKSTEY